QGSAFCQTPNIDRLAANGLVLTNGYAAAGNCAPSRACLISGQYTPRHHVYAVQSTNRGPKNLMRMVPIPNRTELAGSSTTVAESLKAAGYRTGIFGKWHLGSTKNDNTGPTDQGFDVYFDSRSPNPNASEGRVNKDPKGIFSLTEKAGEFMAADSDQPFFCYVAHHAIHTALEARPETLTRFEKELPEEHRKLAMYAACTYDLDAGVGQLLSKLDELGIADNTLVVFTSDNGGTQQSSQEPLRGNKGCYYEGGIREPMIIRWPGRTTPGSRSDVPVINVDLYPTFLAAAGAQPPKDHTLDGTSLLPLLQPDGKLERSAIFWHFPGYLDSPVIRGRDPVFRTRPVSVIRKGEWKLHLYHEEWQLDGGRSRITENNAVELYHMTSDIGEGENLVASNPEMREDLLNELLTWFDQTHALLPTEANDDYDPDAKKQGKRNANRKNQQ
ncbi:MAG: sulfatase, partial [Planctomycetaceae bacterium]|nr:sulfatase [Planctomycetaceae bacterium]